MEFKEVLKTRRRELRLSLQDIANVVGVSKATVQRWETGEIKNIKQDKIQKLADILRTTPSHLMGWSDENIFPQGGSSLKNIPIYKTISQGHIFKATDIIGDINITLRDNYRYFALPIENRLIIVKESPFDNIDSSKDAVISFLNTNGFEICKVIKGTNYTFVTESKEIITKTIEEVEVLMEVYVHGYISEIS